ELEKGLEGMSDGQRAAALETLFGADAMSAWSVLIGEGGDALGEFSSELSNSEGAAGEMADVMEDNLAGSMRNLKSALEGLAISFSEMGEGPIRSLIDWVTGLINKFTEMDESTKQWIIIMGAAAAAIGPLLLMLGAIIGFIPQVVAGFKLLGAAIALLTSPIGLVIAGIGLLVAGIVYLWTTSEEFREFFMLLWEGLQEFITTTIGFIVEFIQDI